MNKSIPSASLSTTSRRRTNASTTALPFTINTKGKIHATRSGPLFTESRNNRAGTRKERMVGIIHNVGFASLSDVQKYGKWHAAAPPQSNGRDETRLRQSRCRSVAAEKIFDAVALATHETTTRGPSVSSAHAGLSLHGRQPRRGESRPGNGGDERGEHSRSMENEDPELRPAPTGSACPTAVPAVFSSIRRVAPVSVCTFAELVLWRPYQGRGPRGRR